MHRPGRTSALHLNLPAASAFAPTAGLAAVPRFIPGGRDFQRRLQSLHRRRRPDGRVPGMPHFAMRDPRMEGLAGALHALAQVLGAQDPVCIRAGREITMSTRQRFRRRISLQQLRHTIFEHRCVLHPAGWMAPQGPATHLSADPPGHGTP